MTDKLTDVARAICDKRAYPGRFDQLNEYRQKTWVSAAKVAIEAMYRPTDFMMEMGLEIYGHNPDMPDEEVEQIWQVMVSAALEGKK